jgi:hypothetical protein
MEKNHELTPGGVSGTTEAGRDAAKALQVPEYIERYIKAITAKLEDDGLSADGRRCVVSALLTTYIDFSPKLQPPENLAREPNWKGALLWALYHHQGGNSPVGRPIRKMLGIGRFVDLSAEQVHEATRFAADPTNSAPDASDSITPVETPN